MNRDPIVEEVHQTRQKLLDECGGDLDRLLDRLKASEKQDRGYRVSTTSLPTKTYVMNPRISEVTAIEGYQLRILFDNGEQGRYDCSGLLNFGVFQELRDKRYFERAKAVDGTVVWPHGQDICPDTLYLDSVRGE